MVLKSMKGISITVVLAAVFFLALFVPAGAQSKAVRLSVATCICICVYVYGVRLRYLGID